MSPNPTDVTTPATGPTTGPRPGAALVRSAATDVVPPLADLGRVHIMGIAGVGHERARPDPDRARASTVSGCEARESASVAALRAIGADGRDRALARPRRRRPTRSSTRPRSAPSIRSSSPPASRASRSCAGRPRSPPRSRAAARSRSPARTARPRRPRCSPSPRRRAGSTRPSRSAATLYESGLNAHLGSGELAIVEADESDGSFLLMRPAAAVITNVEADHLENHGDLEGIFRAFEQFVDRVDPAGALLISADDPGARRIADYARATGHRVLTYGSAPDADVRVSDDQRAPPTASTSSSRAGRCRAIAVSVGALIGAHMAHNAAAALALAADLGMDVDAVVAAGGPTSPACTAASSSRATAGGVRVYDDYAHHPTEIAAVLHGGPRGRRRDGRLIAVFQPGTYSRTQTFAAEFAQALALADIAVVLDIFPAREEPIPGITGATITELIAAAGRAGRLRAELRAPRRRGSPRSPGPATSSSRWASATCTCCAPRSSTRCSAGEPGRSTVTATRAVRRREPPPAAAPAAPRKLPFVVAAAAVVFVLVVVWVVAFSPVLGARTVTVTGTHTLTRRPGPHRRRDRHGAPLIRLDTAAVRKRVEALPDVAGGERQRDLSVDRADPGHRAGRRSAISQRDRRSVRAGRRDRRAVPRGRSRAGRLAALRAADRRRAAQPTGQAVAVVAAALTAAVLAPAGPDQRRHPAVDHAGAARRAHRRAGGVPNAAGRRRRCCPRCWPSRARHFDVSNPRAGRRSLNATHEPQSARSSQIARIFCSARLTQSDESTTTVGFNNPG